MKAAVITFPASNCDRDLIETLARLTGKKPHVIWHADSSLPDSLDLIALPGGFSYGDYLRSGAMAARSPIMQEVIRRANQGVRVIGICNGFQILTESGLLPGTLMRNRDLKFICRTVNLRVANAATDFTRGYKKDAVIRVPIAHHDGNYFADADTLKRLEDKNQIAFQYCDEQGNITESANPNGSQHNIAGIINERGNVLGMMPHPERAAEEAVGNTDGKALFESLVKVLT